MKFWIWQETFTGMYAVDPSFDKWTSDWRRAWWMTECPSELYREGLYLPPLPQWTENPIKCPSEYMVGERYILRVVEIGVNYTLKNAKDRFYLARKNILLAEKVLENAKDELKLSIENYEKIKMVVDEWKKHNA